MQLLGKECKDIDIALDNMMGSEFVEKVRDYLLCVGEEAQGIAIIPRLVAFICVFMHI
jgi:tRNA nucleotidyltransferase/poly(A) polymerase